MDTPSMLTGDTATANTATTEGDGAAATTATADTSTQTTEAAKPAGDALGTDTKKEGDDGKPQGAPEKYEPFTMPEGFEVDSELLGEFEPTLKELGLTQDAAQKVIDFAPKVIEKTVQATTDKVLEAVGMTDRAGWGEASKIDKEFGGDKFKENLALANKAFGVFGTPELKAVLAKTGMGNHPELIRAFYRAGKAISEDSYVPGGKTTTPSNPAESFYPTMRKN